MESTDLFRQLAHYNRLMNESLYDVCRNLSDDERKQDMNAFFGSIHATLNHILLADLVWLGRLEDQPFIVQSLNQELYERFAELEQARKQTDQRIEQLVTTLRTEDLASTLTYRSIFSDKESTMTRGRILLHVFNHQTHHRGQITTMLSQLGRQYGLTDLIAMGNP